MLHVFVIVLESGSARHGAFCCLGWFLNWESGLESATASPDWVKDYLYNPAIRPPLGEQLLPHTHINFPRGPCEGYRGSH